MIKYIGETIAIFFHLLFSLLFVFVFLSISCNYLNFVFNNSYIFDCIFCFDCLHLHSWVKNVVFEQNCFKLTCSQNWGRQDSWLPLPLLSILARLGDSPHAQPTRGTQKCRSGPKSGACYISTEREKGGSDTLWRSQGERISLSLFWFLVARICWHVWSVDVDLLTLVCWFHFL